MLTIALSFLAGIALVQQLPALPGGIWLCAQALATLLALSMRFYRLSFFLFGMLWAIILAEERLSDWLHRSLEGRDIEVLGYIDDLPESSTTGVRFNLSVRQGQAGLPEKIRLNWYQPERPVKAGQLWSLTVRLKQPNGHLNPGGFDYERWLFSEKIGATGYVRHFPKPKLLGTQPPWRSINVWRQIVSDRLDELISEPSGRALIKALSIGDGSGINQAQWRIFRDTGTTHLMVISGSHVGLIAALIYGLARRAWTYSGIMRWPAPAVASLTAMLGAIFYSLLAGFSIPTQRSVIMLSVVMIAIVLKRHYPPWHTFSAALIAVLIFDPLAVLSAGFWLSFLAVALIIIAVSGRLRPPILVLGAVKINWYTATGLTPLILYYFQKMALLAPLANLAAVPVVTLLAVPLSLIGVLLMGLTPEIAYAVFKLDSLILDHLTSLLAVIANSPSATIDFQQPPWWTLALAIPAILLMLAPAGTPSRWLSLVMLAPMFSTEANPLKPGEIHLTMLDVGQGLAAVIRTGNHWLVYDTGARFSENYDMGQSVVLPYLQAQGADRLDMLIISHGDNDHIGGAPSVLKGLDTRILLTSTPELLNNYQPITCRSGQFWQWDEVKFEVLSPPDDRPGSDNDQSCVLRISSRFGSILLPGDIEAEAESWLVATYGNVLKSDILIAPHHGSHSSSTQAFLEAVGPHQILIPAGYRNAFGHPHVDVLSRYRQMQIQWRTSADNGAIEVNLRGIAPIITSLRQTNTRYWHKR